jgi:predicted peroxiredoxin
VRRSFFRQLIALPFAGITSAMGQGTSHKSLNIMMKSAWGSDDPTKAAFPFLHGLALSEAGHSVQIFLLGEAVSLMRKSLANAVVPVGWPPLEQTLAKVAERHVQIYACGSCSRARAVLQTDLDQWGGEVRQPGNLRFARRMGRSHHHGITSAFDRAMSGNDRSRPRESHF